MPAQGPITPQFVPMTTAAAAVLAPQFVAMEPWSRYPISAAGLAAYLAEDEPGAPRMAILVDDALAGAVGFRSEWMRGPYLQFLAVLPDHQNRGIGGLVLHMLEETARLRGTTNAWVAASQFNTRALTFYQRHGFVPVANLDDLLAPGMTEVLLRKRLV